MTRLFVPIKHMTSLFLAAFVAISLSPQTANGQTIYPIDRAEILAGSRFDLKVELPTMSENGVSLAINGRNASEVFGVAPTFIANEEGLGHSALWYRDVSLNEPGQVVVVASTPYGETKVRWDVFGTPPRVARNVILLVGDGLSIAHRTAARILSKGIDQGKYHGNLAMDDMPHMALVSTAGSDSIITDSANSMSAYTTGHKSCVNAMGVYCANNASSLAHPQVETISTLVQRKLGLAVGVVTNSEITDATPAGMVAHIRRRQEMNQIVRMFFDVKPEVMLGGGSAYFKPLGPGSKRNDDQDFIAMFKEAGYAFVDRASDLKAVSEKSDTRRLLGLFNPGDVDGALDLKYLKKGTVSKYPDQPDLVEETRAALSVLSRAENGFLLMVESSRIDKYSHNLDWERAVYDTIMLDNVVKITKDFAGSRNDTMIIVVPDHAHPISLVGTFDDEASGNSPRAKLGVYANAKYPNYPPADSEGYPPTPDVSRRLALLFGSYPDHCFSGRPSVEGEFIPAQKSPDSSAVIANEANCKSGTERHPGNLPLDMHQGVHAGDDVILTASGPGSEQFHGQLDNTFVFKAIATALGLAPTSN